MKNNNNEVEWILIEDKLKKEWKKQDACKKEKKENNNIICFKNAKERCIFQMELTI